MMDEYQTRATALFILFLFSLGLGNRLTYLGFGFYGLLDRRISYDERARTEIGRRTRQPLLIRHADSRWCSVGLALLPVILNGVLLMALYQAGLYTLLPVVLVPLVLAELVLSWWLQKQWVPMYREDYDRYMLLTDPAHSWFNGRIVYQGGGSNSEFRVSGGRIVRASQILPGGQVKSFNFFVSFHVDDAFGIQKLEPSDPVRIFFRSNGTSKYGTNITVDGELVGLQPRKSRTPSKNHGDLEAHGLTSSGRQVS